MPTGCSPDAHRRVEHLAVGSATLASRLRTLAQVSDPILDAVGPRAVRAKILAEASAVCPECGLRHLLDSHCSGSVDVMDDTERRPVAPQVAARPHACTGTPATVERHDSRIRRLFGSVITYLGLDPASFGEVDEGTPSPAPAMGNLCTPESRPRMGRVISFLGFGAGAGDSATKARPVAPPATVVTENDEPAPGDQTAGTDSPTGVEAGDAGMMGSTADAPPHSWQRADDDILYRPSRRPRSPRRAWRDRVSSRR